MSLSVAKKQNTYLVRLNKLYRFLHDSKASVTIEFEDNYAETIRKTYAANEQVNDLVQLFADGCGVSGTALRDITGDRSYTESNEIGKYANIDAKQKDVLKGIHYTFKQDRESQGSLNSHAYTREDLFIKEAFDDYWFANLKNVYPRVQYELHERCLGYVTDFLKGVRFDHQAERLGVDIQSDGPLRDLHSPLHVFSEREIRDTEQVIGAYKQIRDHVGPIAPPFVTEQIIPGYVSLDLAFNGGRSDTGGYETKRNIHGLFDDKTTWFDGHRYQKIYSIKPELLKLGSDKWPRYIKALILIMNAEYAAVKWWMVDKALDEVLRNVEFYITYSSDIRMGEHVSAYHLSAEQLTALLEEYNFTNHPDWIFNVHHNTLLREPVNRYGSLMKANFIYHKGEHLFFLRKKLFGHFFEEITKHMKFHTSESQDFYRQIDIYLRELIRYDLTRR